MTEDSFVSTDVSQRTPEAGTRDRSVEDIHRATYRYLRWSMIVLALSLLLVAWFVSWWTDLPLEGSLSAYYGQPVRDVFVGALIATGACMVVYQGASLLEDYLLNMAGFYAVFVALIPTTLSTTLAEAKTMEDRISTIQAIKISLWFVIAIGVIVTVAELTTADRLKFLRDKTSAGTKVLMAATTALLLGFLALLVFRLLQDDASAEFVGLGFGPEWMQNLRVHDYAAILLILSLAIAVFTHAWPSITDTEGSEVASQDQDWSNRYRVIFFLMLLGLAIGAVTALLEWDYTVIFLEVWQIGAFILFWLLETLRVRDSAAT